LNNTGGSVHSPFSSKCRLLWKLAWLAGCVLPLSACLRGGDHNAPPTPPASFRGLGLLSGYASSQAAAVSSDGSVVAGTATTTAGNRQAFRWSAQQGMAGQGYLPGGTWSMATAVSGNGAVVVGVGDATDGNPPTPSAAFRASSGAGMQHVEPLPGAYLCSAGAVSGDGTSIVGTCLQFNSTAFRWRASTGSVALGRFGGGSDQQSTASAISLDGAVIAGAGHPALTGAVVWVADGSPLILGKLPGDAEATATAVSRDGSVVVGTSTDNGHIHRAFLWTRQTGMVDLGGSADDFSETFATSVSGDGRIVVGWCPAAEGDVALIWDASHGWRTLAAALAAEYRTPIMGWKLARATAISDDARTIAGYGTNPQGQMEGWVVNLP
jgi:probable HAF family extracellular repeat protein